MHSGSKEVGSILDAIMLFQNLSFENLLPHRITTSIEMRMPHHTKTAPCATGIVQDSYFLFLFLAYHTHNPSYESPPDDL